MWIGEWLGAVIEAIQSYGPLGVLVSALLSNLIPGFPAVYLTLVISYAAVDKGGLPGMALVIAAGGIGAGLGKFTEFYLSDILSSRVRALERKKRSLRRLLARTQWEVALLVFIFAALPLPDDVLYIPLGAAGFNKAVFLTAVIAGKIVLTAIVAGLGEVLGWLISENTLLSIVAAVVGVALILALIFKVDWDDVIAGYDDDGWRGATKAFLRELSRLLSLPKRRGQ